MVLLLIFHSKTRIPANTIDWLIPNDMLLSFSWKTLLHIVEWGKQQFLHNYKRHPYDYFFPSSLLITFFSFIHLLTFILYLFSLISISPNSFSLVSFSLNSFSLIYFFSQLLLFKFFFSQLLLFNFFFSQILLFIFSLI